MIVFCAYMGYKVTDIFSLYAKEVMLYDEIAAAGIGSILLYLRPVVGVIIGLLADRTQGSFLILLAFIMMFDREYILCVRHHQSRIEWFIFYRNCFISCRDICFAGPLFFYFERGTYTAHFNGDCSRSHQFYCLYA